MGVASLDPLKALESNFLASTNIVDEVSNSEVEFADVEVSHLLVRCKDKDSIGEDQGW